MRACVCVICGEIGLFAGILAKEAATLHMLFSKHISARALLDFHSGTHLV